MHETLDPIDRLFLERSLRELPCLHRGDALPGPTLRSRVGRRLIRLGAAIAAEPIESAGARRRSAATG